MAGGPHAQTIPCNACFLETGEVVPSERTSEGLETDWYECPHGHALGVTFDDAAGGDGPPAEPMFPPSDSWLAEARMLRERMGKTERDRD